MAEIVVTAIFWSPIAKYATPQRIAFNAIKDSISPQDHASHVKIKLKDALFVTPALFALDALKDISYQAELVKYVALVKAAGCALVWEHVRLAIVGILFLEGHVSYALLFFPTVSSVVILLFACSALVDIISVMEFASVAEQVSINASAATMVLTAPNAKAGTTLTIRYVNHVL